MLHGWIYGLDDGRLQDLQASLDNAGEGDTVIAQAVATTRSRYTAG